MQKILQNAKCIDMCQPAPSAQADTCRYFLQNEYIKLSFHRAWAQMVYHIRVKTMCTIPVKHAIIHL